MNKGLKRLNSLTVLSAMIPVLFILMSFFKQNNVFTKQGYSILSGFGYDEVLHHLPLQ